MLKLMQGSFLEGCGVHVWDEERDNPYHLLVLKEKGSDRLFVEIGEQKYYAEHLIMRVEEFMRGTPDNYHVNVAQDTNDNVVFDGTYAELKVNAKELLREYVTSWDATPMADGTTDIGIMI